MKDWKAAQLLPLLLGCGFALGCNGLDSNAEPGPVFPEAKRVENAVQLRVTEEGFQSISESLKPLIESLMPEDALSVCLPGNSGYLWTEALSWSYCAQTVCSDGSIGCPVSTEFQSFELKPVAPNLLRATVVLKALSAEFDVSATSQLDCNISLKSPPEGLPVHVDILLDTPDPTRDLTFTIQDPVVHLDDLEIGLSNQGGALGVLCTALDGIINFPEIGDRLLSMFEGRVLGLVQKAVENYLKSNSCRSCRTAEDCPHAEAVCEGASDDAPGTCMIGQTCMPALLGVEGEIDLGQMAAKSVPSLGLKAKLQYLLSLGGYAQSDESGLSLGMIAGVTSERNRCVPVRQEPNFEAPQISTELQRAQAPSGGDFDLGIGISKSIVEHALWAAFNTGALCLTVSSELSSMLNTKSLALVFPNLSKITRGSAPVALSLSPQEAPEILWGSNQVTETASGYQLESPLGVLRIPDLWVDFYTYMDARWARLFSLKATIEAPFGITFNANGELIPLLGNLSSMFQDLDTTNDELMADDSGKLKNFLPMLMGPLSSFIAGSLASPIALPQVYGFGLDGEHSQLTALEDGQMLGIFAKLQTPKATEQVQTKAGLKRIERPENATELDSPVAWKRTKLVLEMLAGDEQGEFEHSFQVDLDGWSAYRKGAELLVQSPSLFWPGNHVIQVRSRRVGDARTLDSTPAEISVDFPMPKSMADSKVETEVPAETSEVTFSLPPVPLREYDEDALAETVADEKASSCSVEPGRQRAPWGLFLLVIPGAMAALLRRRWTLGLALLGLSACDDEAAESEIQDAASLDSTPIVEDCKTLGCPDGELCRDDGQCSPKTCDDDAHLCDQLSCEGGESVCISGRCECKPFCAESCGSDQFCCYPRRQCESIIQFQCDLECKPGFKLAILNEGQMSSETCELEGASCDCEPLPPIELGFIGRYSDMVTYGGEAFVSAYDETYGDLVVGRGKPGGEIQWMWVDGVPEGAVVGQIDGPRGGVKVAGDHVGKNTHIAVSPDGQLHVIYYDVTHDALKYAQGSRQSDGYVWQTQTLKQGGQPGAIYSSISVDNLGIPGIAFRSEELEGERVLEYWLAQKRQPQSDEDWQKFTLAHRPSEKVEVGIPDGPGLFVSQARGHAIVVAWYDRTADKDGRLYMAEMKDGAFDEPKIVVGAGAEGLSHADMGADLDVAIGLNQDLYFCYFDADSGLRYRKLERQTNQVTDLLLDDGVRENEDGREYAVHQVGKDCQILLDDDGLPLVIYQDSSSLDVYSVRPESTEERPKSLILGENSDAAFGFYLSAALEAGQLWISNYVYRNEIDARAEALELIALPL